MTWTNPTANLPPARVEPDAGGGSAKPWAEAGRRIAALDDDPTGSQTVHDVVAAGGDHAVAPAARWPPPSTPATVL